MGRKIVLDANIIVAQLDGADALAGRAQALAARLRDEQAELILLDVLVGEAVSVLCRRARERRSFAPDIQRVLTTVRSWFEVESVHWVAQEAKRLTSSILDVIDETRGRLDFNDALLVALQRDGTIGDVASFDSGFDVVTDFRRIQ